MSYLAQPSNMPVSIHKEDTESFLRSIGYWTARQCYYQVASELQHIRDTYYIRDERYRKLRNQKYYFLAKMREYANRYRCVQCHRWYGTAYLRPTEEQLFSVETNKPIKSTKLQHICIHCLNLKLPTYDTVFKTRQRIEDHRQHWARLSAPLGSPTDYAHRRYAAYHIATYRLYTLLLRTPRIIHEWTLDDDILNRRSN